MSEKFTCDICHNTYNKGWTDEEAAKEAKEIWGALLEKGFVKPENFGVVCDDCFNNRTPIEIKQMGDEFKLL
jgi:hypothetical protein